MTSMLAPSEAEKVRTGHDTLRCSAPNIWNSRACGEHSPATLFSCIDVYLHSPVTLFSPCLEVAMSVPVSSAPLYLETDPLLSQIGVHWYKTSQGTAARLCCGTADRSERIFSSTMGSGQKICRLYDAVAHVRTPVITFQFRCSCHFSGSHASQML